MTDETTAPLREDTMLYREPTADSDENAIQDIWGQRLEVRTVDVSEVADLLEQGWVQHPLDLGKKPEERAGFEKVAGKELEQTRLALDTAEKLVEELTAERDALRLGSSLTEASSSPPLKSLGGRPQGRRRAGRRRDQGERSRAR
jgi:hypothetical protein